MNNKAYLGIIVVLLLVCAYLGYSLTQSQDTVETKTEENEALEIERRELELDLQKMRFSYDTLQTENSLLMAEMADQRMQIEDLLDKVKNKNWSISKLKKETETLREIMKGYISTIDSLNQLNQALMAENSQMKERVQNVESENEELLERQQNMEGLIATGQILQTTAPTADAIKLRNNGKQRSVNRANNAEMLKACFTIMENRIAKPGEKELYMRIIDPSGKTLPNPNGNLTLEFAEEGTQQYSVARTIDYNNQRMDVCIFYTVPEGMELEGGDYKMFVYEGPHKIGTIDLSLR